MAMASMIQESNPLYRPFDEISPFLDLPQTIKDDCTNSLVDYLEAIKLDGFEPTTKRKMFVVGNTGEF